jgi:hypothetical protein
VVLPHEITLAEPVRDRCQGCVRRTETGELRGVGVIAEIERYVFLSGNEDERRLSVVKT